MTIEEYKKRNKKNSKKNFSRFLNKVLVLIIIVFLLIIVFNFNPGLKSKIKNKLFKTDYNFSYLNKVYDKYFASVFKKDEVTKKVSKEIKKEKYEKYKDGLKYYVDKESNIKNLKGGIVVYIGEKEGYNNTIVIQQSNGIDAWYGNIKTNKVKLYDYVEEGKVIGTANEYYYLVFEKNKKKISYDDAVKN